MMTDKIMVVYRECKTFDCQLHTNISGCSTWNRTCRRVAASWKPAKNILIGWCTNQQMHLELFRNSRGLRCPTEVWIVWIFTNWSKDGDFMFDNGVFMGVCHEWRGLYSPPTHARGGESQGTWVSTTCYCSYIQLWM